MIKKLQQKIVIIITILLTVAVVVVMLAINIMSQVRNNSKIQRSLEILADKNGISTILGFDPYRDEENLNADSFAVKIGANGNVEITLNGNTNTDSTVLVNYANMGLLLYLLMLAQSDSRMKVL